jgi:HPt (histidine-containing phosphotransfer) domain-containing protein
MSDDYHWRETYYVLFRSSRRPTTVQVQRALRRVRSKIELKDLQSDENGLFESLLIEAPEDYAALEISFEGGEAVIELAHELAKQLKGEASAQQLAQLVKADARLDVMHFEHIVPGDTSDEDLDEMLDPGCLFMVIEALVELTDGIAVDPASGAILP